jgi:hypothetical protein
MGLLTLPLRLPLMPLQGVIRLAELIGEEAEQQLNDPARVRRELEEAQRLWAAGDISDEELARIEEEVTSQLISPAVPEEAPTTTGGERHG